MMEFKIFLILTVIFASISSSNAKGGRGGFSGRGSGSSGGSSRPSSSYSRPAPSYSAPSYTYSRPSSSYTYSRPSPSYTHSAKSASYAYSSHKNNAPSNGKNVNSGGSKTQSSSGSNYGWNVGGNSGSNTDSGSKQSNTDHGWNEGNSGVNTNSGSKQRHTHSGVCGVWCIMNSNFINNAQKPSAPVGPPPAYPGLKNRPVPNNNAPPAYSPSHVNPPAYKPAYINSRPGNNHGGRNTPRQNTYNSDSSNLYSSYGHQNSYGNAFGSQGLPQNTYISNNYYFSNQRSGESEFLTNALFFGMGMHSGYRRSRLSGYDSYNRRRWDEEEDRKWRATTQAPYFENKVPGEDKVLPASAVIGAATAFGLVSLLPLNVPSNKPLMYCSNNTDLMQSQIQINNEHIYQCINNTIEMSCSRKILMNETEVHENQTECMTKNMQCDLKDEEIVGSVYCSNGTLMSKNFIFCNSTTLLNGTNINETTTILNCYEGQLPEYQTAFIPTKTTPQAPINDNVKSLSFGAHTFLFTSVGKGNAAEATTTQMPEVTTVKDSWVPEALTIPPEEPFEWMEKLSVKYENGTHSIELKPVSKELIVMIEETIRSLGKVGDDKKYYPAHWIKVYVNKPIEATTMSSLSTTFEDTTMDLESLTTDQPSNN